MVEFFNEIFEGNVLSVTQVPGGDINDAYKISTGKNEYFAKINNTMDAGKMLESEATALIFLSQKIGVNVPEVKFLTKKNDTSILVLNWINEGNKRKSYNFDFAVMMEKLHRTSNEYFGLEYDNYIGSLKQSNQNNTDWLGFYYQCRIIPQLKIAIDEKKMESFYHKRVDSMFKNLSLEFPKVKPSLLHGDLWAGNYMTNHTGFPVLIDPAIYFGHREVDFAMMRLFGGFDPGIFSSYNELFPFDEDMEKRIRFYQLYYVLVHVNLFGSSYAGQARSIIESYC
ncbi:MAG: fructosamine kinase family protein [Deltaproteobacteria bacterium]